MKHVTQREAFDALCNPDIPPEEAIALFKRAYRRSNEPTIAFVLMMAASLRHHKEQSRRGSDNG